MGGFYHDGRGLRYLQPGLYIKLQDYTGALRYFNWFDKNFPDDIGSPVFLFEYALTTFKRKKIARAEYNTLRTFTSNIYVLDYFLGKVLQNVSDKTSLSWDKEYLVKHFPYSRSDAELQDFAQWLEEFTTSDNFLSVKREFLSIEEQLKTEPVGPVRSSLVKKSSRLLDPFKP